MRKVEPNLPQSHRITTLDNAAYQGYERIVNTSETQTMRDTTADNANGPVSEIGVLPSLLQHAVDARGAYASNTERALRADVAIFSAWCTDAGVPFLPASPVVVARFVDSMGAMKAPATVRRYVSSVATFHRAAGLPSPCEALEVRLALKRLHRAKGRAQAQATR